MKNALELALGMMLVLRGIKTELPGCRIMDDLRSRKGIVNI
jgi:hypothetical protein